MFVDCNVCCVGVFTCVACVACVCALTCDACVCVLICVVLYKLARCTQVYIHTHTHCMDTMQVYVDMCERVRDTSI